MPVKNVSRSGSWIDIIRTLHYPATVSLQKQNHNKHTFNFISEYASYFTVSRVNNDIEIQLITQLPTVDDLFLILEIEASAPDAVSGYATLIIELIRDPEQQIVTPVFSQAYYSGAYSVEDGLLFEHTVQLIQGFDESVVFTLAGGK